MKTLFSTFSSVLMSISVSTPEAFIIFILLALLIYIAIYWRCLAQILGATRFQVDDKILWFLVITLAPVIGIITYWFMVPACVRNLPQHQAHQIQS